MLPPYAIAVPIIGGSSLMLGTLFAYLVDWRLLRKETNSEIAPRYVSVAIEDPKRRPYWFFLPGMAIYAICLPLTTMWHLQMAEALEVESDVRLLYGAIATAGSGVVLAAVPLKSDNKFLHVFGVLFHIPITFCFFLFAFLHAKGSVQLGALLIESGHGSSTALAIRQTLMGLLKPSIILGCLTAPLGIYAHSRLEVALGLRTGTSKIADDKIFQWSLLPFLLGLTQMILGMIVALSMAVCVLEFASM